MEELIKFITGKITSYQLFNYTFTGYVFIFLLNALFDYKLLSSEVVILLPISYYAGLVTSRVGSLIVEPFLKWLKFLKFAAYADYIKASQIDSKIETLSCDNNMYRTFCSVFFILLCVKVYKSLALGYEISDDISAVVLILSQFVLFLFSYKKQTTYVSKRVENAVNN